MNIFIVCSTAAFGKGGMEKVAIELANFLSTRHAVTFCFDTKENFTSPAYPLSNDVFQLPWHKAKVNRTNYIELILEREPAAFLVFGASSALIQYISLAHNTGASVIVAESSNPERVITNNWEKPRNITRYQAAWERELLYSQVDRIHFLMPEYIESLPVWLRKRAVSFPNSFPSTAGVKSKLDSKRIINIGGLKVNKNLVPLVSAFSEVVKEHPDWSVHVYSNSRPGEQNKAYYKEVTSAIKNLNLEKNVFLHDEVDDIYDKYLESSIHIITSLSEGLSNAVSEAMCCGVPTIGIRGVPGVDGLVQHEENGLLVDSENLEGNLAKAILYLIENDQHRIDMGASAKTRSNIFDPSVIFGKWEELIVDSVENKLVETDESQYHYDRNIVDFYKQNVKDFS